MRGKRAGQFFRGLGLGFIALAIVWVAGVVVALAERHQQYSGIAIGITGLILAGLVELAQLVTGVVWLFRRERRFAGYGILAASLVSLAVAQQGCLLISRLLPP